MTQFALKIIAAVSMLLDHAGMIFFPKMEIFRILGRFAFPIFAYCIAEGFRYTRSRMKYFLRIFVLGVLCQIVYTVAERDLYLGVLITFSLSIVLMGLVECVRAASSGTPSALSRLWERWTGHALAPSVDRFASTFLQLAALFGCWFLTQKVRVDYGFYGILLPVCANFFEKREQRLLVFAACLALLCFDRSDSFLRIQYWSLLSLPVLCFYNGKPGKVRLKHFFYIFYPAHLAILYGISLLFH